MENHVFSCQLSTQKITRTIVLAFVIAGMSYPYVTYAVDVIHSQKCSPDFGKEFTQQYIDQLVDSRWVNFSKDEDTYDAEATSYGKSGHEIKMSCYACCNVIWDSRRDISFAKSSISMAEGMYQEYDLVKSYHSNEKGDRWEARNPLRTAICHKPETKSIDARIQAALKITEDEFNYCRLRLQIEVYQNSGASQKFYAKLISKNRLVVEIGGSDFIFSRVVNGRVVSP